MNLNTITRKILLAARKLHLGSLALAERNADKARAQAEQARLIAHDAWYAAAKASNRATEHALTVAAACKAERRELGL